MALTHSYEEKQPGVLVSLIEGLTRGFGRIAEANWRVREVERLNALSDAALAAKGLKREDIARHVFRDVNWM